VNKVKQFANGLLNSHGGVLYFGVDYKGTVLGEKISRKDEDAYRLVVDRTLGKFEPLVSTQHYRIAFLSLEDPYYNYYVIELKISVGELGEIYENGEANVFLVDDGLLLGPLYPQELKELIMLKYKESIEGAEEANKFLTPYLHTARETCKRKALTKRRPLVCIQEETTGKFEF